MLGGIYSQQKCPICDGSFHDNGRSGLICRKHPDQSATKLLVRFKGILRRFPNYEEASRFLTGLRFKFDEGTFDPRDYRTNNPLGLENLIKQWLRKQKEKKSYKSMRYHAGYARGHFGNKNIKEIDYPELEDFFDSLTHLSDKTKFNIRTTLHTFWKWVVRRNKNKNPSISMPDFPVISFKLKYRKTVSLELQDQILETVKEIASRRIWTALWLLSAYPKIRPGELRSVKERDIDLNLGIIRIEHAKGSEWGKEVKLLDEDVDLLRSLPRGMPEMYWIRYDIGRRMGQRVGINYLNRIWKKACARLGVEGVSVYPGTKHSTVRGLRTYLRPDEIQKGTGIKSNKAFERYFATEFEDEVKLYEVRARLRKKGDTEMIRIPHTHFSPN